MLALSVGTSACMPWELGKGNIQSRKLGPNMNWGHQLRDGFELPESQQTITTPCLIIGAGVAGLSAAWALHQQGVEFLMIELEDWIGGNAAWGKNEIGAFPWGAHYLPVPDMANKDLIRLLEDLKVIYDHDESGMPLYDEAYLCMAPEERLYIHGKWQAGLIPDWGVPESDKREIKRFLAQMEQFSQTKGSDGKFAFQIPLDQSSQDPEWLLLDQHSMADWLSSNNYSSSYLKWYVDYCCKDDFGCLAKNTSAWAGIHYFAARRGIGANTGEAAVLTWSEGNGWLVREMAKKFRSNLRTGQMAINIQQGTEELSVIAYDVQQKNSINYLAKHVILACPQYISSKIFPALSTRSLPQLHYAPWIVANISLKKRPIGNGMKLAWDNVAYGSPSLGYIVADHQKMTGFPSKELVITWYHALSENDPKDARKLLHDWDESYWKEFILEDLNRMHPGIKKDVSQIDLWPWGHGMVSPQPGSLWDPLRQAANKPLGNVHFAHTDLSGMSIFEEGFYQGMRAAREVMRNMT